MPPSKRHRRVDPPQGGLPLPHRLRPVHRRRQSAEPHARVLPALAARAREDPQDRHGEGEGAPGVVAIFTGADLEGVNGLPCGWLITGTDGKPMNEPPHPVLAQGKVRYVGDQVALVIAETPTRRRTPPR